MHHHARLLSVCAAVFSVLALGASSDAGADESVAAAGFRYRVTPDHDLPGGDFLATYARHPEECAIYCSGSATCAAYTFLAPSSSGPNCWLKAVVSEPVPLAGAISGVRDGLDAQTESLYGDTHGTYEPGIDRPGEDYANLRLTRRLMNRLGLDPKLTGFTKARVACETLCDRDDRCRAMTVVRAGVQGRSARCFLKSSIPVPFAMADAASSVKLGPPPPR